MNTNNNSNQMPIEETGYVPKTEEEKLRAAYALNICTVSVSQIIQYNDLNFMEREYETILNNLNLENFPKDDPLLYVINKILDVISFFRIQEGVKAMLEKEYQLKMKNAIWSAVPNFSFFAGKNIFSMIFSLAVTVGTGYMNYRKTMASVQLEKDKEEWKLQRSAMEQLHGLQRELFDTAWRLADKYKFPDEYRLTERQITRFNNILSDEDNLRKYERLLCIKDHFKAYPPFWYYLGNAANAVYQDKKNEKYKDYACKAYDLFMNTIHDNSLFREDQLVASCALEYCDLLPDDKANSKKKEQLLDDAIRFSGEAFDIMQLCAMSYLKNGQIEKSAVILKTLINEQYNTDVNAQLLSRVFVQDIIDKKKAKEAEQLYLELQDRVRDVQLFPLPEDSSESIDDLNGYFLYNLEDNLINKYTDIIDKIISRYEARYNRICNSRENDVTLKIAEMLQEMIKVVEELFGLNAENAFVGALRKSLANSKYGQKAYEMWTNRANRRNPATSVEFSKLCANAFKSLSDIVVEPVINCNTIADVSTLDVKLEHFSDKYNLYAVTDEPIELLEGDTSIADLVLGESFEARRKTAEIINKGTEKIKEMEKEIIIDPEHSDFKFMYRDTHNFKVKFNTKPKLKDYINTAIAIMDKPGLVFTTKGLYHMYKNENTEYQLTAPGIKIDRIMFSRSNQVKDFYEEYFNIKYVDLDKLLELFQAMAAITNTMSPTQHADDLSKAVAEQIRRKFDSHFSEN